MTPGSGDSLRILVTGGAGFIGSALVRYLVAHTPHSVMNVDALTYAGNLASLQPVATSPRYAFRQASVCDGAAMRAVIAEFRPDVIAHLAAESHVDRSLDGPGAFIQTNIVGTFELLAAARDYWQALESDERQRFRFHHISTDEVFGSLSDTGQFSETSPYDPRSPYSASKAASDHLVRAWHHSYGLPILVTNCSNNYGPYHFPEKLIPLTIIKALQGEPLPVYGDGSNVRDWLYVDDHVRGLAAVFAGGVPGSTYMIGGGAERRNIDVVETVCDEIDKLVPRSDGKPRREQIVFVADRPGHDHRYAVDSTRLRTELGWAPIDSFETGIAKTVRWYLDREDWWRPILDGSYRGERLGLTRG